MNEIAYAAHIQQAKQAQKIHDELAELYPDEPDKDRRRLLACRDHIIDTDESNLLRRFCL